MGHASDAGRAAGPVRSVASGEATRPRGGSRFLRFEARMRFAAAGILAIYGVLFAWALGGLPS